MLAIVDDDLRRSPSDPPTSSSRSFAFFNRPLLALIDCQFLRGFFGIDDLLPLRFEVSHSQKQAFIFLHTKQTPTLLNNNFCFFFFLLFLLLAKPVLRAFTFNLLLLLSREPRVFFATAGQEPDSGHHFFSAHIHNLLC